MNRYLVLGAAGFLGQHITRRLASEGEVVTAGLPTGRGLDVKVDLATAGPDHVARMIAAAAPDAVVNCTGLTRGEPAALANGNVVTVATLIQALGRLRTPAARTGQQAFNPVGPGTPEYLLPGAPHRRVDPATRRWTSARGGPADRIPRLRRRP